jgi:hypothetical protein
MQELFRFATEEAYSTYGYKATVVELKVYHDYRKLYRSVLNTGIKNYGFPHRFKLQRHPTFGIAYMQYQGFTPVAHWDNQWLPHPPPTNFSSLESILSAEVQVDIAVSKYMLFDNEKAILKALDLETVADMRVSDVIQKSTKKTIRRLSSAMEDVLPFIAEIERKAIFDQREKNKIEAEWELLPIDMAEKIAKRRTYAASVNDMKGIEEELARGNTKAHGYITWLKRSMVDDPNYLSTRPDVLPNPKLWDSIITGSNAQAGASSANGSGRGSNSDSAHLNDSSVVAELTAQTNSHGGASELEVIDAEATESSKIMPPLRSAGPGKDDAVPDAGEPQRDLGGGHQAAATLNRKLTAEENEARTRRDYLKSAASRMASAAKYMIDNVPTLYRKAPSANILHVTNEFRQTVLTSVEMLFFEDHKDTDRIIRAAEVRALQSEREPWELLRLPIMERREIMMAGRAEREQLASARAMIIADRRGHLSYDRTEVITREGNENAGEEAIGDLNQLTMPRLKIAARNANLTGYSGLKKKELVERLQAFLVSHPTLTIATLLEGVVPLDVAIEPVTVTAPVTGADHPSRSGPGPVVTPSQLEHDHTTQAGVVGELELAPQTTSPQPSNQCCSVCECIEVAVLTCDLCQLKFCGILHALHSSHRSQTLRDGYTFPEASIWTLDTQLPKQTSSIGGSKIGESRVSNSKSALPVPVDADSDVNGRMPQRLKRKDHPLSDFGSESGSQRRTLVIKQGSIPKESQSTNQRVVQLIRLLNDLQGKPPVSLASVEALLSFSSYNLDFFKALCEELSIELPLEISNKRRITPLDLRTAIAPLILALM